MKTSNENILRCTSAEFVRHRQTMHHSGICQLNYIDTEICHKPVTRAA